jgi:hypothetical protein
MVKNNNKVNSIITNENLSQEVDLIQSEPIDMKETCENSNITEMCENININVNINAETNDDYNKPALKKRGRKPKGGKIVQQVILENNNKEPKLSVILHLKCSLKDLKISPSLNSNLESFNFDLNKQNFAYEIVAPTNANKNNITNTCNTSNTNIINMSNDFEHSLEEEEDYDTCEDNLNKQQKIVEENTFR